MYTQQFPYDMHIRQAHLHMHKQKARLHFHMQQVPLTYAHTVGLVIICKKVLKLEARIKVMKTSDLVLCVLLSD